MNEIDALKDEIRAYAVELSTGAKPPPEVSTAFQTLAQWARGVCSDDTRRARLKVLRDFARVAAAEQQALKVTQDLGFGG